MTTKYLTGAYPTGYLVQSGVTYLDIESTASVGGYGVRSFHAVHVDNEGVVNATGNVGMQLYQFSSSVINGKSNSSALIEGSVTGFSGGNDTLNNYGTIVGLGTGQGVSLFGSALVTNGSVSDTTALIQGGQTGAYGDDSAAVVNFATIVGTQGYGVRLAKAVTNGSSADHAAYIRGGQVGVDGGFLGQLTNYGTITGGGYGAEFLSGGTILNHGTISGSGSKSLGIALYGDSRVVNGAIDDLTALVQGGQTGVVAEQDGAGLATIVNYATIEATGAGGYGVVLHEGTLTNGGASDCSALIEGAVGVLLVNAQNVRLHNYGVIRGTASAGLMVYSRDNVFINGSRQDRTARIIGVGPSMLAGGGNTVINYGTISGLTITGYDNLLEVAAQSDFGTNPVTIDGTLALIGGNGTLSGLANGVTVSGSMAATTFNGFNELQIGKNGPPVNRNAQFTLIGSGTIASGQFLGVYGRLTVKHDLTVAGTVTNVSTGVIALAAHATAEFEQATPHLLTVSFLGSQSLLELTDPSQFGATIAGMVRHGKIDLVGIAADKAVLGAGDKLVMTDQGQAVATLQLAGAFGADTFTAASDGKGGTLISVVRTATAAPPSAMALRAPHAFIAAAAAVGATAEAAHATAAAHDAIWRPILSAPRAMVA